MGSASPPSLAQVTTCWCSRANERYAYQRALSDISGWDILAHDDDFSQAIRCVRTWLQSIGEAEDPASTIIGRYVGFQEWDYERLLERGWTEEDIQLRQTPELMKAMDQWVRVGKPVTHG